MRSYIDVAIRLNGHGSGRRRVDDPLFALLPAEVESTFSSQLSGDVSATTPNIDWPTILALVAALNANNDHGTQLFELGSALGGLLLPGRCGELFQRALAEIRQRNGRPTSTTGLRLRIRANSDELAALPWEAASFPLVRGGEGAPLAQQSDLSIVRSEPDSGPPTRISIGPVVQVATVDASAAVLGQLIDSDVPALPKKSRGRQRTEFRTHRIEPNLDALERELGRFGRKEGALRLDVFHFSGHLGNRGLLFERAPGSGGPPQPVAGTRLGEMLYNAGVQLAVLSACNSGSRGGGGPGDSEDGAFAVALEVARRSIPAVVAMQHRITDRDARLFSARFYDALRKGESIDEAVSRGRRELARSNHQLGSWATPVLYLNSDSGAFLGTSDPVTSDPASSVPPSSPVPSVVAVSDLAPVAVDRTWAHLARDANQWRLTVGRSGLVRTRLDSDVEHLPQSDVNGHRSLATSVDARVVAQLADGTLTVAWIARTTGELRHWSQPIALFLTGADARLLAIASSGTNRARCVISSMSGTHLIRVGQFGEPSRDELISPDPSRAALLVPGGIWTVTEDGEIRQRELGELLSRVDQVIDLDAAYSGRTLVVAALGQTGDGQRRLLVSRTGEPARTFDSTASLLTVVRQLDPRLAPDCVLTRDGGVVTAYRLVLPAAAATGDSAA